MKTAVILALCASTILAKPLVEYEYSSTTTTTVSRSAATGSGRGRNRAGDWRAWRKISGKEDETAGEVESTEKPEENTAEPAVVVPVEPQNNRQQYQPQSGSRPQSSESSKPAESTTAPVTSNLGGYKGPILDAHNVHRANHSVAAVQWSDDLASIAAQIAASCVYAHDTKTGGGGYGQNIGAGTKPEEVNGMITNAMYNGEIEDYPGYGGEPNMGAFHKWGHFSQIVWKSTTEVGCATQYCPGGLANTGSGISPYFTVCNYKPAGNFGGQYGANVLAPGGAATVVV